MAHSKSQKHRLQAKSILRTTFQLRFTNKEDPLGEEGEEDSAAAEEAVTAAVVTVAVAENAGADTDREDTRQNLTDRLPIHFLL